MRKVLIPGMFLFITLFNVCGQTAELKGTAPKYAGTKLVLKSISNPVTGEYRIVDTLCIDEKGNFKQQILLEKPTWAYINTGLFRIYIYMIPLTGYEISLPPKTEKTQSDIRNPYFKPVLAHLLVLSEYSLSGSGETSSGDDINSRIFRFDTLLFIKNKEMLEARQRNEFLSSDSLISVIENSYKNDTSSYFKQYRKFRYGIIKINGRDTRLKDIYEQYLAEKIPVTGNPAFMDLFNEMYKEFIFYYSRTEEGRGINNIINRTHDITALRNTLLEHPAVPSGEFAELVIIKEIHDLYFKKYFNGDDLLQLLDTIIESPVSEKNAMIARGVKRHLTRLMKGNYPPHFELPDIHGNIITPEDLRGKYVYLNFCTTNNYGCLTEYPFLQVLHRTHKKHLEIVTVIVAEDPAEMKAFMKNNNYTWTALFYNENEKLLWDYDIKAFPTNYLLDPEGKLVLSPAAMATEGFEQQLFRIMRSRGDL